MFPESLACANGNLTKDGAWLNIKSHIKLLHVEGACVSTNNPLRSNSRAYGQYQLQEQGRGIIKCPPPQGTPPFPPPWTCWAPFFIPANLDVSIYFKEMVHTTGEKKGGNFLKLSTTCEVKGAIVPSREPSLTYYYLFIIIPREPWALEAVLRNLFTAP